MQNRLTFTKKTLESLPNPKSRRYVYDDVATGLALCLHPSGTKTFYWVRRIKDRVAFIKLDGGTFPAMTVEQARKAVTLLNGEMASGHDPLARRQSEKEELTLKQLSELWLDHAKVHKRSWQHDEKQLANYVTHWLNRRLSTIQRSHAVHWHRKLGDASGHYAANRALALLRAMWNYAITHDFYEGVNPFIGIKAFPEIKRDVWVQPEHMPTLLVAIDQEMNPDWQDYFKLLLMTGARRMNVLAMQWKDVDLTHGTWTIPSAHHKTKRTQTIPLVGWAIEILNRRVGDHGHQAWVFPSHGKTGHVVEPKGAWARITTRAGLSGLRIHDLRHTIASWQASQGVSLTVIGKGLGHTQTATTSRYAHLSIDPVREAMTKATEAMRATLNPKADVTPIHPKRKP